MQTTHSKEGFQTYISDADRQILARIIGVLGQFVQLEPIGRYVSMSADEVWLTLVIQVCVMGSARPIERLTSHPERYKDFEKAVALSAVSHLDNT